MSALLNKLKKSKTPEQLVTATVEALDSGQDINLSKRLSQMKVILYGEEEREPDETRRVSKPLRSFVPCLSRVSLVCGVNLILCRRIGRQGNPYLILDTVRGKPLSVAVKSIRCTRPGTASLYI